MMDVSKLPLIHGGTIPQIGLGTATDETTEQIVTAAIGLGYRLLDTAENYQNEVVVGRAIGPASSAADRRDGLR
jgi:2,5-diketo-D-gluconate reductase A